MYKVQEVANWFLNEVPGITNKKLQKLVYYAYAWHLVLSNESVNALESKLFDNNFEAWVHGAVYPELYYEYKKYGSGVIPGFDGNLANFSDDEVDILHQVVEVYGAYTGNQLESICHKESPWMEARGKLAPNEPSNEAIKDDAIFNCYSARL